MGIINSKKFVWSNPPSLVYGEEMHDSRHGGALDPPLWRAELRKSETLFDSLQEPSLVAAHAGLFLRDIEEALLELPEDMVL